MKISKIGILTLSFAASMVANADEVNGIQYNSIDIGYGTVSLEGGSGTSKLVMDKFKATGIKGTYRIDSYIFTLGYETAKSNGFTLGSTRYDATSNLNLTSFEFGYRLGISTGFDIVPSFGHESQKLTIKRSGVADSNSDSSGNFVSLTAYNKLTDSLQGTVSFTRNSDEENTISAGLLFKLNKNWGLRASYGYQTGADNLKSTQMIAGISYLF